MKNVKFINFNDSLPEYIESYLGYFVLNNSKLYVGTPDGWKELTNISENDLLNIFKDNDSFNSIIGEYVDGYLSDCGFILDKSLLH